MVLSAMDEYQTGSQGEAVKELQSLLTQRGYAPGPIDGIFGAQTKTAVMRFQSDRGFSIDGIVGPTTWAALHGTLPAQPAPTKLPAVTVSTPPTTITLAPGSSAQLFAGASPVTLIIGGIGLLTLVTMSLARPKQRSTRR